MRARDPRRLDARLRSRDDSAPRRRYIVRKIRAVSRASDLSRAEKLRPTRGRSELEKEECCTCDQVAIKASFEGLLW